MAPTAPLAVQGPQLLARGYPIIPIKPGTKHPGFRGWQKTVADDKALASWLANGHAQGGVGVLTKHFPAIDLDVRDPDIVAKLVQWCVDRGLRGPMRVGEAPKLLIACRTDEPFSKVSSAKFIDFMGLEHKVEVLGDGQQYVAYATHPDTKQPYKWVSDSDLAQTKPQDLPVLTHEQAVDLVDYFHTIVPSDWERAGEGTAGSLTSEPIDALLYAKPAVDVSQEKLERAVNALDPDMLMADWVRVGMGLYHQFNGSAEGFALWDIWSSQGSKYNEKEMRARWRSFKAGLRTNPTTAATILEMAKRAKASEGFEAIDLPKGEKPKRTFKIVHASEVLAKLGPIDWLVNGYLERNTTGLLFGDPGAFKSFIALDMAFSVAAGRPWHGYDVEAGPVVYIAGEGHGGLARRFAAWEQDRGVSIAGLPFYVSEQPARLYDAENAKLVVEAVDAIAQEKGRPRMVVIDTLARNFGPADENSNADMGVFIHHVDTLLRLRYGATVMIVHHSGHSQKQRARGATALKGGMDFEYRVERADGALSTTLICTKMKDAKEPEQVWFEGREVLVGALEDEDMTSLVFDRTAAPVEQEPELKGNQKTLYDIIENEAPITRETLRVLIEKEGLFSSWNVARNTLRHLVNKEHVVDQDGHLSTQDAFLSENSRANDFCAPCAPPENSARAAQSGFAHLDSEDD